MMKAMRFPGFPALLLALAALITAAACHSGGSAADTADAPLFSQARQGL